MLSYKRAMMGVCPHGRRPWNCTGCHQEEAERQAKEWKEWEARQRAPKESPKKSSPQAAYMARKRIEWRAAGRCINDGREAHGKRRCPTCQQRHNAAKRKSG